MKTISEDELHSGFELVEKSRAAIITFICGALGIICCVVIVVFLQILFASITDFVEEKKSKRPIPTVNDQIEISELITQKTIQFNRVAFPLFMIANIAWVAGGFCWTLDLGKQPKNQSTRLIGGILVFATALACGYFWYFLLSRFAQG